MYGVLNFYVRAPALLELNLTQTTVILNSCFVQNASCNEPNFNQFVAKVISEPTSVDMSQHTDHGTSRIPYVSVRLRFFLSLLNPLPNLLVCKRSHLIFFTAAKEKQYKKDEIWPSIIDIIPRWNVLFFLG